MKQTFIITAETTQEELIAHCASNNIVDIGNAEREKQGLPFKFGSFGVTRDYDLENWNWPVYRGFAIEVHWENNRKKVKCKNSPNCLPQYKHSTYITQSTKCSTANKPFFCVALPAFEGVAGISSKDFNKVRKAIDKAIFNGEKYWGWTETDRTSHLIKHNKSL